MDVTPVLQTMTPVLTAVIAAGATLWGVALTQAAADRREAQAARARRADAAVADLRAEARQVVDLLVAEGIDYDRIAQEVAQTGDFDEKYEAHVYAQTLLRLGQAINMLPSADARAQLSVITRNLGDRDVMPRVLMGPGTWRLTVPILLNAATDIASAYARGETPDLDKVRWYRRIEAADEQISDELAAARARHPSILGRLQSEPDGH